MRVHHEPVAEAVAYRVETPDGVVVISGDTRVCEEVEDLSSDADLLVHEACRTTALADLIAGTAFETIFSYHADTIELGAMAARTGVPHVMLTHLIPPPDEPGAADAFASDLRTGGYAGQITVGEDLASVTLPRPSRSSAPR
jgi:ribonuclease Z